MSDLVYIAGYGCTTSAGIGSACLWRALETGATVPHEPIGFADWPVAPDHPPLVFQWRPETKRAPGTYRALLVEQLRQAWEECRESGFQDIGSIGVILASTKGAVEDWVWQTPASIPESDSLQPVLEDLLLAIGLQPTRQTCVSSACSSSQVALELGRNWILQGHCDEVLVFAADAIGPFIGNGFAALKALSPSRVRPFTKEREGLQLGEAAAVLWLSHTPRHVALAATSTISEGHAATRPSREGLGLRQAIAATTSQLQSPLDGIIAHGTGTRPNDATEDRVFAEVFASPLPVTAIKWAVGHCMGASGALDIIVACEALKRGILPPMRSGGTVDPDLKGGRYLHADQAPLPLSAQLLVTSLGFGGINAASVLCHCDPRPAATVRSDRQTIALNVFESSHSTAEVTSNCTEPGWAPKVDRWYQLDQPARALPQAFAERGDQLSRPGCIFLASRSASNQTDWNFVSQGAIHPAKFVHTLPNVRACGLLQLMQWQGPVYTLQAGLQTVDVALREAYDWVCRHQKTAWVVQYEEDPENAGVSFWELQCGPKSGRFVIRPVSAVGDHRRVPLTGETALIRGGLFALDSRLELASSRLEEKHAD